MRRKLKLIDAAATLESVRVPPGNRLEALKGDRRGQHGIRVNDQWRAWLLPGKLRKTLKRMFGDLATGRRLTPVHPSDVLLHDFMEPMGLSADRRQ